MITVVIRDEPGKLDIISIRRRSELLRFQLKKELLRVVGWFRIMLESKVGTAKVPLCRRCSAIIPSGGEEFSEPEIPKIRW